MGAPVNVALQLESVDTNVTAPSGAEAGRVDLTEVGGAGRRLQIVMGRAEARAIDDARRGRTAPRPLPWDLLNSVLVSLGATLDSVVITEVEEGRLFRAEIVLHRDGQEHRLAARPSDALALAVRCGCERLLATAEVMDQAAIS
jgi:bifunctional DNase/RNase